MIGFLGYLGSGALIPSEPGCKIRIPALPMPTRMH